MASSAMEQALKMAAVTGLRSALGPALVAHAQERPERHHLALAALGELVFDKLPFVPSRDALPSLIARGLAGAWAASKCVEASGERAEPWAAPLGAAVAVAVAVAAPKVRVALGWTTGIPQPVLGLIEDYLALRLGTEALGLSMGEVSEAARESLGGLRERFHLDDLGRAFGELQSAGAGSM